MLILQFSTIKHYFLNQTKYFFAGNIMKHQSRNWSSSLLNNDEYYAKHALPFDPSKTRHFRYTFNSTLSENLTTVIPDEIKSITRPLTHPKWVEFTDCFLKGLESVVNAKFTKVKSTEDFDDKSHGLIFSEEKFPYNSLEKGVARPLIQDGKTIGHLIQFNMDSEKSMEHVIIHETYHAIFGAEHSLSPCRITFMNQFCNTIEDCILVYGPEKCKDLMPAPYVREMDKAAMQEILGISTVKNTGPIQNGTICELAFNPPRAANYLNRLWNSGTFHLMDGFQHSFIFNTLAEIIRTTNPECVDSKLFHYLSLATSGLVACVAFSKGDPVFTLMIPIGSLLVSKALFDYAGVSPQKSSPILSMISSAATRAPHYTFTMEGAVNCVANLSGSAIGAVFAKKTCQLVKYGWQNYISHQRQPQIEGNARESHPHSV